MYRHIDKIEITLIYLLKDIYIYIYMCVCVCGENIKNKVMQSEEFNNRESRRYDGLVSKTSGVRKVGES